MKLYCSECRDTFTYDEKKAVLPARCVGCIYDKCVSAMRSRVQDDLKEAQLEFDFGND